MMGRLGSIALAFTLMLPCASKAETAPARVVSINLCTDQLALLLAAPGQLMSVSYLAKDPATAALHGLAQGLPENHAQTEEIVFLRPDLVLAGRYSAPQTIAMLRRLGIRVELFEIERDFDETFTNIARMGEILHRQPQAEAMIAQMRQQIAQLTATRPAKGKSAAIYYAMGYTSGRRSLAHEIAALAGLENIAEGLGFAEGGSLPLEALILAAPEVLVRGKAFAGYSLAEAALRHPALRGFDAPPRAAAETGPAWACGLPQTLEAVAHLRSATGLDQAAVLP